MISKDTDKTTTQHIKVRLAVN